MSGERVVEKLRKNNDIIRKNKRESSVLLKRFRVEPSEEATDEPTIQYSQEDFVVLCKKIQSNDINIKSGGLKDLRRLLCSENPPIQETIAGNLIPCLCEIVTIPSYEIKSDAIWCLTNLATGDHDQTNAVLEAVPVLLQVLESSDISLQEQVCWTIGNIAGDCDEFRIILIANGCVLPITRFMCNCLRFIDKHTEYDSSGRDMSTAVSNDLSTMISKLQTTVWAISNLVRGATHAEPFLTAGSAALLIDLCGRGGPMLECAKEAAWALAFLTAKDDNSVTCLISLGIVPALLSGLAQAISVPFIRCLGNLSSGPEAWLHALLSDARLYGQLLVALDLSISHRAVVKEACWLAGNVLAAPLRDPMATPLVTAVLELLLHSDQFDLQREAVLAFQNAAAILTPAEKHSCFTTELLRILGMLVRSHDQEAALASVRLLAAYCVPTSTGDVAETGRCDPNLAMERVRQAGVLEALDDVQYGAGEPELRLAAGSLAEILYAEEEDETDTMQEQHQLDEATHTPPDTVFGFGLAPAVAMGRGRHLTQPAWMTSSMSDNVTS